MATAIELLWVLFESVISYWYRNDNEPMWVTIVRILITVTVIVLIIIGITSFYQSSL